MTNARQLDPKIAREADRMPEHALDSILDDRDMRRFMPPQSPLPMPVQDLTSRFGLRRALSVIGFTVANR